MRHYVEEKTASTFEYLGCTPLEFTQWQRAQYTEGMTIDNKHNDHMMPCKHFDMSDPEHVRRCFHHTNYQPLPANENNAKSNKIIYDMVWREVPGGEDHWFIKLGDVYVSRIEQVAQGISTHDYYPKALFSQYQAPQPKYKVQ